MAQKISKMEEIFDLGEKVAIITGGYGHLGSAMTNALLKCNVNVIVAGRSYEKFLNTFEEHPNLYFEEFDIGRDSSYFRSKFEKIYKQFGRIDILINNATFTSGKSDIIVSDADWDRSIDGVLSSVYRGIVNIKPFMEELGGKIINISSMYGILSPNFDKLYKGENCEQYLNPPHYGAAKAGIIQLTKYYAVAFAKHHINVNAIAPGPFPRNKFQEENPKFIERLKSSNPLHRIGQPDDLAGIIILLSSSASNFITGQNIQVDGGWTNW